MPESDVAKPRGGRPRSAAADAAILEATRDLLIETGFGQLSMERVAARAGVGLQTVYRRWRSKTPLVAAAVMDAFEEASSAELPHTDDVIADLRAWVSDVAAFIAIPENAALQRALAVAASESNLYSDALNNQLIRPQHQRIMCRLEQAREAGQIRRDCDLEAVVDALLAIPIYRMLTRPDDSTVDETVDRFIGLVQVLAVGMTPTD